MGVLFDPTVPACKKGKVLDKNGRIIGITNRSTGIYVGKYNNRNTRLKNFSKDDIDKGVFLPFAGAYTEYNDGAPRLQRPGGQAYYWTSDANPCQLRPSNRLLGLLHEQWLVLSRYCQCVVEVHHNPKYNMYNIRPVYASCTNEGVKTKNTK